MAFVLDNSVAIAWFLPSQARMTSAVTMPSVAIPGDDSNSGPLRHDAKPSDCGAG